MSVHMLYTSSAAQYCRQHTVEYKKDALVRSIQTNF